MSTGRIGNSPGSQTPLTTANQAAENIGSTTSSSPSPSLPPKTQQDSQSDSKTIAALKQRGGEVKSQQQVTAGLVKQELEKRLENVPGKTVTLERDAGNDKLAKIHVQREVHTTPPKKKYAEERTGNQKEPILHLASIEPGSETISTKFPNGVGIKTDSYIESDGKRGLKSISIEPPPGGKIVSTPDGSSSTIYDASGKEVGKAVFEPGEDGAKATINIHSREGDYKLTGDDQITFTPKARSK